LVPPFPWNYYHLYHFPEPHFWPSYFFHFSISAWYPCVAINIAGSSGSSSPRGIDPSSRPTNISGACTGICSNTCHDDDDDDDDGWPTSMQRKQVLFQPEQQQK